MQIAIAIVALIASVVALYISLKTLKSSDIKRVEDLESKMTETNKEVNRHSQILRKSKK